jgi:Domain of Unknown Function (DUF1080)
MTRTAALTLALVLTGAAGVNTPSHLSAQAGAGWTTLFDGKTLTGWNVLGDANWSVANGEIVATAGTGFLVTPASYGDFQMTLEFWVDDIANSGVFIRMSDPKSVTAANSYEVNIFDQRPDQAYRTGGIVDVVKPNRVENAGGKWNTFDITARGPKMTIVMNGKTIAEVEHAKFARGPIALQRSAGTVKFKNVRIRTL